MSMAMVLEILQWVAIIWIGVTLNSIPSDIVDRIERLED
jgi:hypothetical protein